LPPDLAVDPALDLAFASYPLTKLCLRPTTLELDTTRL